MHIYMDACNDLFPEGACLPSCVHSLIQAHIPPFILSYIIGCSKESMAHPKSIHNSVCTHVSASIYFIHIDINLFKCAFLNSCQYSFLCAIIQRYAFAFPYMNETSAQAHGLETQTISKSRTRDRQSASERYGEPALTP